MTLSTLAVLVPPFAVGVGVGLALWAVAAGVLSALSALAERLAR